MAKVKVEEVQVIRRKFILELTEEEAAALRLLTGQCSGPTHKTTMGIFQALFPHFDHDIVHEYDRFFSVFQWPQNTEEIIKELVKAIR